MTTVDLGTIEPVDIRSLWREDSVEFARWLSENLQLLGEALHLDLELVRLQPPAGWFPLSILAKEVGSDAGVVISAQLGRSAHSVLGSLAGAAAAQDARILIWVTPHFRPEHRQALEMLNARTPEQIEAYGVEMRAIRIGDSRPAHDFRPVVFADAWAKRAQRALSGWSLASQRRYDFFQPLIVDLWNAGFTNRTTALSSYQWHPFPSGFAGVTYFASFGYNHTMAYLWIHTDDGDKTIRIYDALYADQSDIKNAVPGIEFETYGEVGGSRHGQLRVTRPGSQNRAAGELAREQLNDARSWLYDNLLRLKEVCHPRLEQIFREIQAGEDAAAAAESEDYHSAAANTPSASDAPMDATQEGKQNG